MILLLAMLQAAAPAPAAPAEPIVRPASPRALSGRFTCDPHVYEVAVTTIAAAPVRLDRLAFDGRPVDAGTLAEATRMAARITDVQSIDVRCRGDDAELTIYGTQRQATSVRRARLRGEWRGTRIEGLTLALEQR